MIVRFTLRAERDLAGIVDHLTSISPGGARNVAGSLRESIRVIGDHPFGGQRTSKPALLVKIVPKYPYKIFYRVRDDSVEIVHIRHASRRPWLA